MTKQWNVCAGDPSWVDVPDLAKPINCFSRARAKLIVDAVNAYLAQDEPSVQPPVKPGTCGDPITLRCDLAPGHEGQHQTRDRLLGWERRVVNRSVTTEEKS